MDYFKHFNTVSYDIYGDGKTRNIADVFRKVRIDPKVLDDITFYRYYVITNGERPDIVSYKLYRSTEYHWTFSLLNPWMLDVKTDWPMSIEELNEFVARKYPYVVLNFNDLSLASKYRVGETLQGLASGARGVVISKDVNLGEVVIRKTNTSNYSNGELVLGSVSGDFLNLTNEVLQINATHHYELADGTPVDRFTVGRQSVTNFEHELAKNEEHTRIKVIRPELIGLVADSFINIISK